MLSEQKVGQIKNAPHIDKMRGGGYTMPLRLKLNQVS